MCLRKVSKTYVCSRHIASADHTSLVLRHRRFRVCRANSSMLVAACAGVFPSVKTALDGIWTFVSPVFQILDYCGIHSNVVTCAVKSGKNFAPVYIWSMLVWFSFPWCLGLYRRKPGFSAYSKQPAVSLNRVSVCLLMFVCRLFPCIFRV